MDRREKTIEGVEHTRRHHDSSTAVFSGQLNRSFEGLAKSLATAFSRPTGEAMPSMFAKAAAPALAPGPGAPLPPPPPPSHSTAPSDEVPSLFGGFAPVLVAQRRAEPGQTKAKAKPKATSKAGVSRRLREQSSSAASGDDESATKRARGRPRNNRRQELTDALEGFKQCTSDEKYFDKKNPNFRRHLDTKLQDFTNTIHPPDKVDEILEQDKLAGKPVPEVYADSDEVQALRKMGQEAANIAKAWVRNMQFDKAFTASYVSSLTFLRTPPVADLPFPGWMMQEYLDKQVEAVG
eukprot:9496664-Pyramimonas_sp.AAC.1